MEIEDHARSPGKSRGEIVSEFPHLTLAGVYAASAYNHNHREDFDAEIAADRAWYEKQREKQPFRLRDLLKARMAHAQDDSIPS